MVPFFPWKSVAKSLEEPPVVVRWWQLILGVRHTNIALTIFSVAIEVAGVGGWLQLLHRHNAVSLSLCFYIGGSAPVCDVPQLG